MVRENGIYWHYLSSWCQPDSINSSSEEWMRLRALSGGIVPVSCLLFACLPLSVMKTFLLMAGVREAKPILQFLMAAAQILCSPRAALRKPLFFLPPSKHAFNQLRDLAPKSSFRDLLMKAMMKRTPRVSIGKGLTARRVARRCVRSYHPRNLCLLSHSQRHLRRTDWNGATRPRWQMRCLFLAEDICGDLRQKQQITHDGWTSADCHSWVQDSKKSNK